MARLKPRPLTLSLGADRMSLLYIARSTEIAARVLGGEMMIMSALDAGVPLSVHLDVTYRCNERCVHCYLDHDDHGEMTTAEMLDVIDQLAEAGVFFLTLSGGEVLMRMDFFDILERARSLQFCVK